MTPEQEARKRVVEIALTWVDTPFHDGDACKGIKGVGVDCAYLPGRVGEEAGLFQNFELEPYSPQMMLHSSEERYVTTILKYAHEITEAEVQPGDVVIYKVGRSFSHGGIVIRWPDFILHPVRDRGVIGSHGTEEGFLRRRQRRFFSFF
jgi:cell wall-associated NlpC family hydrolase